MQMVKCEWQHFVPIVNHSTGQYYWSRDGWSFKTTLTQILLPSQSHIFLDKRMMTYHCLSISWQFIAQFFCQWYQRPILNHCGISDHLFFTPLVYNHKCKLVIKITSLPQTSRVDVYNNCCWNQHFRQWNQRHWIHHWWNGTFQVTEVEIAIFMAFKSGFIRIEA